VDFEPLLKMASSKGFDIDATSNKYASWTHHSALCATALMFVMCCRTLAASLNRAVDPADASVNFLLRSMATFAMSEATYFSTGTCNEVDFYHYGLAARFYTHFTSPIRRYADLIVHRQLWYALQQHSGTSGTTAAICLVGKNVTDICEHINKKNRSAKSAQRDSSLFFQSLYFTHALESRGVGQAAALMPAAGIGGVQTDAIIYEIRSSGFYVLLPKYPFDHQSSWLRVES
jgi:exoribonuclease R